MLPQKLNFFFVKVGGDNLLFYLLECQNSAQFNNDCKLVLVNTESDWTEL